MTPEPESPELSDSPELSESPALRIEVFTIFPELVDSYCLASIVGRSRRSGLLDLRVHDLRSAASDPHRSVDDAPFGGGPGMVLAPELVFNAVEAVGPPRPLLLMSPVGRVFDQAMAGELVRRPGDGPASFSLLCGRYEGVDQRIADHLVDSEVSIGDFVLAGGELGALVVIESVVRLVAGVLGNESSIDDESFSDGLLEYPHYTRPATYRGFPVPEVLLSGDHGRVAAWRLAQSINRTLERRPDLISRRGGLSKAERQVMALFDMEVPAWVPERDE